MLSSQIRKVSPSGTLSVFAGTGMGAAYSGDGGPATSAQLNEADGMALDPAGNFYIDDSGNSRIRKVDTAGVITTVARSGSVGPGFGCQDLFTTGCPAINLKFSGSDVPLDSAANLFVAKFVSGLVYKITGVAAPATAAEKPVIAAVVNAADIQPGFASNTWVSIGGKAAYVDFVSPGQINVLAPEVAAGPVNVTVTTAGGASAPFAVTASEFSPALLTWPDNQPVATRQDFSFAVKAGTFGGLTTAAAKPGDVLILWGTGLGATSPAAPAGVLTPSDMAYLAATAPTVTVNGVEATAYGTALTPGAGGLYQIAIQVPPSLGDGDWEVRVTSGGVQSPAGVLLAVHQ